MKEENVWWAGVLILTVLFGGAAQGRFLPENWWLVPWLISLILFGLPHGAIDHKVALTLWQPKPPPRWAIFAILAIYVFLSVLVLGAWFLIPNIIFVSFILLTSIHWGLSDLWWSWKRDKSYFSSRCHQIIFALARGSIPMLVPLASYPVLYRETAEATCNLFSGQPSHFDYLESTFARGFALSVVVILCILDLCLARCSLLTRLLNLAETFALFLFFSLVPAILAVGFYFALWHGLRHVLRLKSFERLSWAGFTAQASPATVGALILLGGFAYFIHFPSGYLSLLGIYLSVIAALTFPHALIVNWMDVSGRLWKMR